VVASTGKRRFEQPAHRLLDIAQDHLHHPQPVLHRRELLPTVELVIARLPAFAFGALVCTGLGTTRKRRATLFDGAGSIQTHRRGAVGCAWRLIDDETI
jgi:hypothetical protein